MKKLKAEDVLDILLRGFMPEVGKLSQKIINNFPKQLKNETVSRIFYALSQLIEKGWKENRLAEFTSDAVERFAAELEKSVNSANNGKNSTEKWFQEFFQIFSEEVIKAQDPTEVEKKFKEKLQILRDMIENQENWKLKRRKKTEEPEVAEKISELGKKSVVKIKEAVKQVKEKIDGINKNSSRWRLI